MEKIIYLEPIIGKLFEQYDLDDNKLLDRKEVTEMINDLSLSMHFAPLTTSEITKLMSDLDENEDNLITLDELQTNLLHIEKILKARYKSRTITLCKKIFNSLQKNESES